jgi:hypothetical protein
MPDSMEVDGGPMWKYLVIVALFTGTPIGKKVENCKLPPAKYGPSELADCMRSHKDGTIGCMYHMCIKDPVGQDWCGAVLLVQRSCREDFKPAVIELLPKEELEKQPAPGTEAREEKL